MFAGTSKEIGQLQRECVHSVAILGTDPLDIPPKPFRLLVRLGSPDTFPSVPDTGPDFHLMSHLKGFVRLGFVGVRFRAAEKAEPPEDGSQWELLGSG